MVKPISPGCQLVGLSVCCVTSGCVCWFHKPSSRWIFSPSLYVAFTREWEGRIMDEIKISQEVQLPSACTSGEKCGFSGMFWSSPSEIRKYFSSLAHFRFHIFLLFSSTNGMEWECQMMSRVLQFRSCDNSLLVYYQSGFTWATAHIFSHWWCWYCHLLCRGSSG